MELVERPLIFDTKESIDIVESSPKGPVKISEYRQLLFQLRLEHTKYFNWEFTFDKKHGFVCNSIELNASHD